VVKTLGNPNAPMGKLQMEIKPHIFSAFYLNFPMLERWFTIPSREKAKVLVRSFKSQLVSTVLSAHNKHPHKAGMDTSDLGCRLVTAYEQGIISRYHFQQNLVAAFIAGHENPQILLLSLLLLLADHPGLQSTLRDQIRAMLVEQQADASALSELPLLTATIYETLRLYPPISQLLNRRTTSSVILGDSAITLKPGTYVGYNGYTTNRDTEFWGSDSHLFRPERWGRTAEDVHNLFRKASSKGCFISFHGGKRTCLGIKYAMNSTRVGISVLLREVEWRVDPGWARKMTPAGPLMPKGLKLQFSRVGEKVG
jgi:cytochrome P450